MAERVASESNVVIRYLREVRGELRKVTWPSRNESRRLTIIVLAVTIAFAIFLWIFDTIFSGAFELFLFQVIGI